MGNPESDPSTSKKDDILTQSIEPRENLINSAVAFLSDKKIQNQDPNLVKQFLKKKGLTEEEVLIAFGRSEATKNVQLNIENHFAPPALPPPLPPPALSVWHTVHSVITTVTSIGGIVYVIYWFWKNYVSPYLFGRKPKKKPVERSLAELEAAVGSCVEDVKAVRSNLQTLTDQKAAELTNGVIVSRIQEVKSEINSLKSLLLNRSQFPPAPPPVSTGPISIPAWQLSADTSSTPGDREDEGEEEGSGSNGTTNGSDSSLEIVKDPNH